MFVEGARGTRECPRDNRFPRLDEEYKMIMFQEDCERGLMMARRKYCQFHL